MVDPNVKHMVQSHLYRELAHAESTGDESAAKGIADQIREVERMFNPLHNVKPGKWLRFPMENAQPPVKMAVVDSNDEVLTFRMAKEREDD